MTRALAAGLIYGLAIFALGFLLGTLRELVLAPVFGRTLIVWIEAPLILIAAWLVIGRIVRRFAVPPTTTARLVMGSVAFALLMFGEAGVSILGFGRTLAEHLAIYASARGVLELGPQLAFALFPLLQRLRERNAR